MTKKIHNPKSFAPAVYIPCWLIQVPIKLLSHAAKMLYGRLSQWANENGTVYRTIGQLSEELGTCRSSIEKHIKELKDMGLIGTYQQQNGGINHYEFYDHEWMHEPIKEQLVYKSDRNDPPYDNTVPPVRSYGTPPYDHTDINNNININNNNTYKRAREDEKNLINKSKPPQYSPPIQDENLFEQFYEMYPIKKQKQKCKVAWFSQGLDMLFDDIMEKLRQQIEEDADFEEGYIPHPFTYITQERWTDEIKVKRKITKNKRERLDHDSLDWAKDFSEHLSFGLL